jgi:hypothetical protein
MMIDEIDDDDAFVCGDRETKKEKKKNSYV